MGRGWYRTAALVAVALALAPLAGVHAQDGRGDATDEMRMPVAPPPRQRVAPPPEPWLFVAEADGLVPVSPPEANLFEPGGAVAVSIYRPVLRWLLFGARLRGGLLGEGGPPPIANEKDPGVGGLLSLAGAIRLRFAALGGNDDGRRNTGPWLELSLAPLLTGTQVHVAFEPGLGWNFEVGSIDIGPTVRYLHAFHAENDLDPRDAHILVLGVEVTFLDNRVVPPHEAAPRSTTADRDHDGIPDASDDCPEEAEDADGFQDQDGCPDPDNDHDGIADATDHCPEDPEDRDGFEDADGCPDSDNDHDGIPDDADRCPNEAETVNGVDDGDGCPDEGLIQLVEDRVVIEEEVLFDLRRSRIKHAARPVLLALAHLIQEHPEWVRLRIEGHADARGDADFNQRLSEDRARRVRDYLVSLGVAASRIDSAGFGSSQPRDQATTEVAYARNRRVEFVVLSRQGATAAPPPAPAQARDTERP